jgi:5-methylcytosine-specific restriction enzyme A
MTRPCLSCGTLIGQGSRCSGCQRTAPTTKRDTSYAERMRRKRTVDQHRDEHGDWCPGYRCDPHPATDLTAEHLFPVAAGGADNGALTVLCRSCNSRRGARP